MGRKRISEQKREVVLQKLEDSELTVAEFCRRRGLCYGTEMRWRREARNENAGPHGRVSVPFVEVDLAGAVDSSGGSHMEAGVVRAELSLPGGAVLRVFECRKTEAEA